MFEGVFRVTVSNFKMLELEFEMLFFHATVWLLGFEGFT